jgi:hypothetical protein
VTSVARYLSDSTPEPRAAISALPRALLRPDAAPSPDGRRVTEATDGERVDLLADVCPAEVARARNGYPRASDIRAPEASVAVVASARDPMAIPSCEFDCSARCASRALRPRPSPRMRE